MSCAGVLLAGMATGCFVSRKETVREEPRSATTVERRSTVETVPGDTSVRTKTTVEKEY
jgi:hypothetical protein